MNQIKNLNIILAMDNSGLIGIENNLPWEHGTQKADMKRFKTLTTDGIVVMGYKTFESMGSRGLPKRHNIVLTSKENLPPKVGVEYHAPEDIKMFLIELCGANTDKEVFIIGGANLIGQVSGLPSKIYLTIIDHIFIVPSGLVHGDCVFVDISELAKDYRYINAETFQADTEGNNHGYTFYDLYSTKTTPIK